MTMLRTMLILAAAATVCSPAGATTITSGTLTPDCYGYTLVFNSNFVSGESTVVDWRILLTKDGQQVELFGQDVVNGPTTEIERSWPRDFCGWTILAPAQDDGNGTWWRYPDPNNGDLLRSAFSNITATGPTIACPCTPTGPDVCRTPGFWGTHAGLEKKNSQNITQAVIDEVGSLTVCGKSISTTVVRAMNSAVEGMCVSPQGEQKLQLARQLTAAALNCVMTNGSPTCVNTTLGATFQECNSACAGGPSTIGVSDCIKAVDCFNNGGTLLANGYCQVGTCGNDGVTVCDSDGACLPDALGNPVPCVPLPGNCHDRPLVNADLGLDFDPPGPAGSSNACNAATSNTCTIFSCP